MRSVALILPHQLHEHAPLLHSIEEVYLIEEYLFFKQYKFHQQKLAFHRATLKFYASYLEGQGKKVVYLNSGSPGSDLRETFDFLKQQGIDQVHLYKPCDDWVERRLLQGAKSNRLELKFYESPLFINSEEQVKSYFSQNKKRFLHHDFYVRQRKSLDILMNQGAPEGGKWSFDQENRKPYPKSKEAPKIGFPPESKLWNEACEYVAENFHNNPGQLDQPGIYPVNFDQARIWLQQFLESRFKEFGRYEDAMVQSAPFLHHSVLSPLINCGLLDVRYVISQILSYAKEQNIPLNSTEGIVRQIIGWREFIRGLYLVKGRHQRTHNFWKFTRKIPQSFYHGTTGIEPVDHVIKGVLARGYCHHIERLMVLGNFMLLCEFDPDEVYRWFMELFIDAYDWVMVPNVYGMSQFADGGLMATKPYISGSNYIRKMSDFQKGDWQQIWDGLFWRFIDAHRDFFSKNPRSNMMVGNFDRMDKPKQQAHLQKAHEFLSGL